MKDKLFKYFLFFILGLSIFLLPRYIPFLEKQIPAIQARKLTGKQVIVSKDAFSIQKCFNKSFQKNFEANLKQESPIADMLIRGKNQIDYQLFNQINTNTTFAGKNEFLYSKAYAEAYIGKDFLGENEIISKVQKLKKVAEALEKKGIKCLVINPPSKPRAIPEFLPDFYQNYPIQNSNWTTFNSILDKEGIPSLQLDFLLEPYEKENLPLYPKLGLHWNYLGMTLVAEELRRYSENIFNLSLPKMEWQIRMKPVEEMLGTDIEMMNGSNLWRDLPSPLMPYPEIEYLNDSLTSKPNVLVIGDSYYKIIYDYGLQEGLFDKMSSFFYYYKEVYPKRKNPKEAKAYDILKEIKDRDLIIFSHAEVNLERFGFGFIEKLEEALFN